MGSKSSWKLRPATSATNGQVKPGPRLDVANIGSDHFNLSVFHFFETLRRSPFNGHGLTAAHFKIDVFATNPLALKCRPVRNGI